MNTGASSMLVKICGLCVLEHALAAISAGADWLGFVFAPSRRRVTVEQARAMISTLRQHTDGQQIRMVGLFVNERADQINQIVQQCGLDYVQLSGDETPRQAQHICRPVIKSLRLTGSDLEAEWLSVCQRRMEEIYDSTGFFGLRSIDAAYRLLVAPVPLLIDAHVAGAYGGTGTQADWGRAAELARIQPLMLAGGLTPENVDEAIRQVCPHGVDVSSGVETDGSKDVVKIRAFIHAARLAVPRMDG